MFQFYKIAYVYHAINYCLIREEIFKKIISYFQKLSYHHFTLFCIPHLHILIIFI